MKLFSYCIPIDDGAAPNPYWGWCTLAICKPMIRRVAEEGDWVVGIGSKNVAGVNYAGKLVYAMKVTRRISWRKYDRYCLMMLKEKIPNLLSDDYRLNVGDCIYDFHGGYEPTQRGGVHEFGNIKTDIGGENVLMSDHFYYFGNNAVKIPEDFSLIVRQGQSHQSKKNEPIKNDFIKWLQDTFDLNKLYGDPQIRLDFTDNGLKNNSHSKARCSQDDEDLQSPDHDSVLPLSHWNYFLALEADLKTISRYIEFHQSNFGTFSIGLAQIFQATCSEIDVVLKDLCETLSGRSVANINEYRDVVIKRAPGIISKKVSIPLHKLDFNPWKSWENGDTPDWWTSYNKVKHHRNTHYDHANLKNALNALSALYIVIYDLIRVYRGKTETEFSANLIYKHLQPRQELLILEGESTWRDIAEGKKSMF
jgi:hypothetical protein